MEKIKRFGQDFEQIYKELEQQYQEKNLQVTVLNIGINRLTKTIEITNQLNHVKQDFLYNLELLKERDLDLLQIEKQLNSLKSQNKELIESIERKEQEKQELSQKYLIVYKEKQDLKQEFWEIKTKIQLEFEEKINEKHNDFQRANQEIEHRNSMVVNEFNSKMNELEKEREQLKFQIKMLIDSHQQELLDLEKSFESKNLKILDDYKQIKIDYLNISKQNQVVESRLLDASNTIKNLEIALRDSKWEFADERQILNEKMLELQTTIQQEKDYYELERKEYIKERNHLLQEMNRINREKKSVATQNIEYQKEIQSMQLDISNHQIELQDLKNEFEKNVIALTDTFELEKHKLIASHQIEIDDLQSKLLDRSNQEILLNQLKLSHSRELSTCKKEIANAIQLHKQEIIQLNQRIDLLVNEKSQLENRISGLNDHLDKYEAEIDFKNTEMDQLNSTIHLLETRIDQLVKENTEHKESIHQHKQYSLQTEQELIQENDELKSIIHQMRLDVEQFTIDPQEHFKRNFTLLLSEYKKIVKEKSILLEENNRLKSLESNSEAKSEDRKLKIKRKIRNYNERD
ncbi:hypothetical protein HDV06_000538 [Boothiomyces sp. JEL0866]|nr:hypothetical protein HDV06_000538 [Boothiomyces sp. JEL0866]